jgi:hypothetical protein
MGLGTEPYPEIYLPFSQSPSEAMVVMIRTSGDPSLLAPAVRRRVAGHRPQLAHPKLAAFHADGGGLALGAALQHPAAGIVRGIGDGSRSRRHIRAAELLGARPRRRDRHPHGLGRAAAVHSALGRLAGFAAVTDRRGDWHAGRLGASRWLEHLVFGVADNFTALAAAALTVIAVAMIAAAIPVWRATQVDAMDKLHRA